MKTWEWIFVAVCGFIVAMVLLFFLRPYLRPLMRRRRPTGDATTDDEPEPRTWWVRRVLWALLALLVVLVPVLALWFLIWYFSFSVLGAGFVYVLVFVVVITWAVGEFKKEKGAHGPAALVILGLAISATTYLGKFAQDAARLDGNSDPVTDPVVSAGSGAPHTVITPTADPVPVDPPVAIDQTEIDDWLNQFGPGRRNDPWLQYLPTIYTCEGVEVGRQSQLHYFYPPIANSDLLKDDVADAEVDWTLMIQIDDKESEYFYDGSIDLVRRRFDAKDPYQKLENLTAHNARFDLEAPLGGGLIFARAMWDSPASSPTRLIFSVVDDWQCQSVAPEQTFARRAVYREFVKPEKVLLGKLPLELPTTAGAKAQLDFTIRVRLTALPDSSHVVASGQRNEVFLTRMADPYPAAYQLRATPVVLHAIDDNGTPDNPADDTERAQWRVEPVGDLYGPRLEVSSDSHELSYQEKLRTESFTDSAVRLEISSGFPVRIDVAAIVCGAK